MSLLDLQALEPPTDVRMNGGGSRASKGCTIGGGGGGPSRLSVTLC